MKTSSSDLILTSCFTKYKTKHSSLPELQHKLQSFYLQSYDFFFLFFLDLANVLRLCHLSLVRCLKRLGLVLCISFLDVFKLSPRVPVSSAHRLQGLFPLPFHFLQVCVKGRKAAGWRWDGMWQCGD